MPMVATVRIRRGERLKRRMNSFSTRNPRTMAASRPMATDDEVGEPGHPVGGPAVLVGRDEHDGEQRRHHAEVALGEVDDPVGSVDEGDARRPGAR